ncbi:MAG: sulfotransferase [Caldilineales bacterium]
MKLGLDKAVWYRAAMRGSETLSFAWRGRPQPQDALLLVSSSRSGSTWLADWLGYALHRQQIFEPLHPHYNPAIRRLTDFTGPSDHLYSFYLPAQASQPAWKQALAAALSGRARSVWTDDTPTAWLPRGFLVKEIRATLLLGYVMANFTPRVIYLLRHPCAVVHSRLRLGWQMEARALLRQEALVEDLLRPWLAEIEQERDPAGAHGLWWAVENLAAQRALAGQAHCRVFYEQLMADPTTVLQRVLDFTGGQQVELPPSWYQSMSRTTFRAEATAGLDLLLTWRQQLAPEQQARVLAWAERLGVTGYTGSVMPQAA